MTKEELLEKLKNIQKMKTNKGIIICGIEGFSKSYFEMLQK